MLANIVYIIQRELRLLPIEQTRRGKRLLSLDDQAYYGTHGYAIENHQDRELSVIHYHWLRELSVSGISSWLPSVKRKLGYRSSSIGFRSHIVGMHGNITLLSKTAFERSETRGQDRCLEIILRAARVRLTGLVL